MPAMVRAQQRVHEDDEGNHLNVCASVCLVAQRLRAHPLGRACTHTCTHDLSYARTQGRTRAYACTKPSPCARQHTHLENEKIHARDCPCRRVLRNSRRGVLEHGIARSVHAARLYEFACMSERQLHPPVLHLTLGTYIARRQCRPNGVGNLCESARVSARARARLRVRVSLCTPPVSCCAFVRDDRLREKAAAKLQVAGGVGHQGSGCVKASNLILQVGIPNALTLQTRAQRCFLTHDLSRKGCM